MLHQAHRQKAAVAQLRQIARRAMRLVRRNRHRPVAIPRPQEILDPRGSAENVRVIERVELLWMQIGADSAVYFISAILDWLQDGPCI